MEARSLKQEDDWTRAKMSAWSLTLWQRGSDVKNRLAANNPGTQADESLQIFLIELVYKLHLSCYWNRTFLFKMS